MRNVLGTAKQVPVSPPVVALLIFNLFTLVLLLSLTNSSTLSKFQLQIIVALFHLRCAQTTGLPDFFSRYQRVRLHPCETMSIADHEVLSSFRRHDFVLSVSSLASPFVILNKHSDLGAAASMNLSSPTSYASPISLAVEPRAHIYTLNMREMSTQTNEVVG